MGFANGKGKGPMRKISVRAAVLCAAIAGTAAGAFGQAAPSSGFFAWDVPSQTYPNYTESPFLSDDASAAQVSALFETFRTGAPSAGNPFGTFSKPLAVKVNQDLSANAKKVFDNYPVQYVFADYEGPPGSSHDPVSAPLQLSNIVANSAASQQAFVGNFNIYPNAGSDTTRPGSTGTGAPSFTYKPFDGFYQQQRGTNFTTGARGRLMSNEALYPGAPDYKTPVAAPAVATPGTDATKISSFETIRTNLFTLPIQRLTTATNGLGSSSTDAHIPWVDRFNNYGNNSLNNAVDPTGKFQYQFVSNATDPKKGGLLSRGDFMALVLHYRQRGADSYMLFNDPYGSVINYSDAQEHLDAASGWGASGLGNQIQSHGKGSYAFANLANLVNTANSKNLANYPNGQPHHALNSAFVMQTSDKVGVVWSGVYSKTAFAFGGAIGTNRALTITLSNLSNTDKLVDMPNSIGGFRTATAKGTNGVGGVYSGDNGDDDYWVGAGQHRIMNFALVGGKWVLKSNSFVFGGSDSVGALDDRNGTGVPEPTSAGALAIAAVGLLARRRRQTAAV